MRYSCDRCEYAATTATDLKKHIEFKHEGVRYPCDKCEYAATTVSSLKKHNEIKHKEDCGILVINVKNLHLEQVF